jgi:hypothetical protein
MCTSARRRSEEFLRVVREIDREDGMYFQIVRSTSHLPVSAIKEFHANYFNVNTTCIVPTTT